MPKRGRNEDAPGSSNKKARRSKSVRRSFSRSRSVMPPETKYFDTAQSQTIATAADWTGSEVPSTTYINSDGTTVSAYTDSALIPSAIGAGYGQVNGNKYYLKNIRVRGAISPVVVSDSADVPAPAVARVVLVHDTQPNGAQAQGEEVFTDMGTAAACNYSFLAMGAGAGGRFRILKDMWVELKPAAAGTDGANTNSVVRAGATFSMSYSPKKPIQVVLKANSATPTVASLSNNNFFLLAHADVGAATINAVTRAYYQD